MAVALILGLRRRCCFVAALAAIALAATRSRRRPSTASPAPRRVLILIAARSQLLIGGGRVSRVLPLGLPWLGAHFRLDALAAFFLVVVNLGGAAASLYALGYGRHEPAPQRVLPFFPAFLAGMNLVRAGRRRLHASCSPGSSCRWRPGRW